jgi:hypothetical protein
MEGAGAAAGEAYAWAIENPDKVSCVYGENPILRSKMSKVQPLDNLMPLAKAGVPLLHQCKSPQAWVKDQTVAAEHRYQTMGGQFVVLEDDTKNSNEAVDFIAKCALKKP